jgi:hypothetical protein
MNLHCARSMFFVTRLDWDRPRGRWLPRSLFGRSRR